MNVCVVIQLRCPVKLVRHGVVHNEPFGQVRGYPQNVRHADG